MKTQSGDWSQDWDLVRDLGEGGQGTTHLVTACADGKQGVLKLLKKAGNDQARKRMRFEVEALKLLSSFGAAVPAILATNVDEADDSSVQLFFVMEFIDGQTLHDYVNARGKLTIPEATDLVLQIATTLEIGHNEGLGHRDIKPRNVMVLDSRDNDKKIVVLDYGISYNTAGEGATRDNENFWNEFYTLPETNVDGGRRRDLRTDVAMACGMFFFCLTGQYPQIPRDDEDRPPHKRPGKTLSEHVSDQTLIPHLDSIFFRGFSPDINKRFQDIGEFSDELHQLKRIHESPRAEDPSVVAARESEIIRLHDRKTQLAEIRPVASQAKQSLTSVLAACNKSLDSFHAEITDLRIDSFEIPDGYELAGVPALSITISNKLHKLRRPVKYLFAVRDFELTVLKYVGVLTNKRWIDGRPIYRFPVSESPDWSSVEEDYKNWLNAAIVSIREEIVGATTA